MRTIYIAKKIEENGGKVYLVGGAIRDSLIGKKINDEDYCVVGISETKFKELFPMAIMRGRNFKVFDIEGKEFALARKETKTGTGHKEFEIITGEDITIEEDLKRRDLTINAIAQDVITKEIIDPYNGQIDMKDGIARATSDSFREDPLRVYRVARIAATLELKVEANTIEMMKGLKKELNTLSKERVFEELKKALNSKTPSIFFNVLKEANVLDVHFKEIYDLIGAIQPEKYHPEGDSYNHTMLAVDNSAKITDNTKVRFCSLVHDLGKGRTPKEMYPHHYEHEKRGVEPLEELSKRLGIPKDWEKSAKVAILEHMKAGIFFKMTPSKQVQLLEKVEKSNLGLKALQNVVYCDRCRNITENCVVDNELDFLTIGKKMFKEIDGKYIYQKYGLNPGIEFGKKLHQERVTWIKHNCKGVCNTPLQSKSK